MALRQWSAFSHAIRCYCCHKKDLVRQPHKIQGSFDFNTFKHQLETFLLCLPRRLCLPHVCLFVHLLTTSHKTTRWIFIKLLSTKSPINFGSHADLIWQRSALSECEHHSLHSDDCCFSRWWSLQCKHRTKFIVKIDYNRLFKVHCTKLYCSYFLNGILSSR